MHGVDPLSWTPGPCEGRSINARAMDTPDCYASPGRRNQILHRIRWRPGQHPRACRQRPPQPAPATDANASAESVAKPPAISIANTHIAAVDQAAAAASKPGTLGCCRTWLPSEAIAAVLDAKPAKKPAATGSKRGA